MSWTPTSSTLRRSQCLLGDSRLWMGVYRPSRFFSSAPAWEADAMLYSRRKQEYEANTPKPSTSVGR